MAIFKTAYSPASLARRSLGKGGNASLVLTLWQTVETRSDSAVGATCF